MSDVERRVLRRPGRRLLIPGTAALAVAAALVIAASALPGPSPRPVAVTAHSGERSADTVPPVPPALPEGIVAADTVVPAGAATTTSGVATATTATSAAAPSTTATSGRVTVLPAPAPGPAPAPVPVPGTGPAPAPGPSDPPPPPPPCGEIEPVAPSTTQVDSTSMWCYPLPVCDASPCCTKTSPCPPPCAQPADNGTSSLSFAPCPAASGVEGSVHAGPTCPVEREDEPCPDHPVETTLRLLRSDGSVAASGQSGADGTFHFAAPPGKYQLVADYGSAGGPGGCAPVDVVIEDGRYTYADVSCDTGIR